MFLKYCMTRDVHEPTRGHPTDAGIDFYMPTITLEYAKLISENKRLQNKDPSTFSYCTDTKGNGESYLIIDPYTNILIPSGIKVEIPYGYMGLFLNKSGVASKKEMIIGAQVIDTFYSGEVHIDLHNVSDEVVYLYSGEKLAQMVLIPILSCDLTEVDEDTLYDWMKQDSLRGANGFGSTDEKSKKNT
jgi:dUTP pyrophosphatase